MFFKEVLVVVRARVATEVAEFCPNLEFFNLRFQEILIDASSTSPEQSCIAMHAAPAVLPHETSCFPISLAVNKE